MISNSTPDPPAAAGGTLVCVVDHARNLPNKRHIGKQDPFCVLRLGRDEQRTVTVKRGGQHPRWDAQLHFTILPHASSQHATAPSSSYSLTLACYADDAREPELIGQATLPLIEVLTKGEFDTWIPLHARDKHAGKDRYAGEVYVELTFYSAAAPPPKSKKKKQPKVAKPAKVPSPLHATGSHPALAPPGNQRPDPTHHTRHSSHSSSIGTLGTSNPGPTSATRSIPPPPQHPSRTRSPQPYASATVGAAVTPRHRLSQALLDPSDRLSVGTAHGRPSSWAEGNNAHSYAGSPARSVSPYDPAGPLGDFGLSQMHIAAPGTGATGAAATVTGATHHHQRASSSSGPSTPIELPTSLRPSTAMAPQAVANSSTPQLPSPARSPVHSHSYSLPPSGTPGTPAYGPAGAQPAVPPPPQQHSLYPAATYGTPIRQASPLPPSHLAGTAVPPAPAPIHEYYSAPAPPPGSEYYPATATPAHPYFAPPADTSISSYQSIPYDHSYGLPPAQPYYAPQQVPQVPAGAGGDTSWLSNVSYHSYHSYNQSYPSYVDASQSYDQSYVFPPPPQPVQQPGQQLLQQVSTPPQPHPQGQNQGQQGQQQALPPPPTPQAAQQYANAQPIASVATQQAPTQAQQDPTALYNSIANAPPPPAQTTGALPFYVPHTGTPAVTTSGLPPVPTAVHPNVYRASTPASSSYSASPAQAHPGLSNPAPLPTPPVGTTVPRGTTPLPTQPVAQAAPPVQHQVAPTQQGYYYPPYAPSATTTPLIPQPLSSGSVLSTAPSSGHPGVTGTTSTPYAPSRPLPPPPPVAAAQVGYYYPSAAAQ